MVIFRLVTSRCPPLVEGLATARSHFACYVKVKAFSILFKPLRAGHKYLRVTQFGNDQVTTRYAEISRARAIYLHTGSVSWFTHSAGHFVIKFDKTCTRDVTGDRFN